MCWALFDANARPAKETPTMIVSDLGARLGIDPDFLAGVNVLGDTRMGLYVHEGFDADGRILPPIPGGDAEWVSVTTPYVMAVTHAREWIEYLGRASAASPPSAYERHMKFGPHARYWPEYLMQAYIDYRNEAIYIRGIPDRPESLPASDPKRFRP